MLFAAVATVCLDINKMGWPWGRGHTNYAEFRSQNSYLRANCITRGWVSSPV
jgi:hypothetical protein